MNNFKKITIGDVAEIKHGWAFPGSGITEYPSENVLVTPGSFKIGGGFKKDNKKFFNGYYPDEYLLTPDDLIVTMTDLSKATDTLGYSALVPNDGKKYLHNQRIGLVQIKSKTIDKNYLYWLLRTYHYQRFIAGAASGTTVKHTSPTQIKSYSFYCPPIETQKQIAGILFSFDDKIELNAKINHNLEEQAKAIFDNMFPNICSGNNCVGNIICPKRGRNLLSKDAIHGEVPVIAGGLEPATFHNIANTKPPVLTISASVANAGYVSLWMIPVWSSDSSFIDSTMTDHVYFLVCISKEASIRNI